MATSSGATASIKRHSRLIDFTRELVAVLSERGTLAPAWRIATEQAHAADPAASASPFGQIDAARRGDAAESADSREQQYGVLIAHLGPDPERHPDLQPALAALTETLRDVDHDGYLERSQWVAAQDAAGHAQGLLAIDFNGDGVIETGDLLNLGGNVGEADSGRLAAALADRQVNNALWLDANGDGVLDARDPAFAAIRVWLDANGDAQSQAGEQHRLGEFGIAAIDFKTGAIRHTDGTSSALTATTLGADTDGVRLTRIEAVDAQGNVVALDAGEVMEHEGYRGQGVREASYTQQAKRVGDWEGTEEADAHRHGGNNVGEGPAQTVALAAEALAGEANAAGAATPGAPAKPVTGNAPIRVEAGDRRIASAPGAEGARLAFVPLNGQSGELANGRDIAKTLILSAEETVLGGGGLGGLGLLAALGLGAVQAAQAAENPTVRRDEAGTAGADEPASGAGAWAVPVLSSAAGATVPATATGAAPGAATGAAVEFLAVPPPGEWQTLARPASVAVPVSAPAAGAGTADTTGDTAGPAAANAPLSAPVAPKAPAPAPVKAAAPTRYETTPEESQPAPPKAALLAEGAAVVLAPVALDDAFVGGEDTVLRLAAADLLGNDRADGGGLRLAAVGGAQHGSVRLENGAILFTPEADFFGEGSFEYTVADAYGQTGRGTARVAVGAVNDAPVALDDALGGSDEDAVLRVATARLLANDADVDDDAADLRVVAVGNARHGTVRLEDGEVLFVPEANFYGTAGFEYTVADACDILSRGTARRRRYPRGIRSDARRIPLRRICRPCACRFPGLTTPVAIVLRPGGLRLVADEGTMGQ